MDSVEGIAAAVRSVDETMQLLASGLTLLTNQQNTQVEMLARLLRMATDIQQVAEDIHDAVTAPAPPSPITALLATLVTASENQAAALARIERALMTPPQ
jgi:hypothetical protein